VPNDFRVEVMRTDHATVVVVSGELDLVSSAGITFGVVSESPQVRRLLTLTRMDERMPVAQTPEELLGGS
jgi:anti-anti-sigma regulatory factor